MKTRILSPRFRYVSGPETGSNLSADQNRCIRELIERIDAGSYRFRHERCPCGMDNAILISEVDRYGLPLKTVVCKRCGTLRFDPYLEPECLDHFYAHLYQRMYARAADVPKYFEKQGRKIGRLLETYADQLPPNASVLEVGCGTGGALVPFKQRGFQTYGCDFDSKLIEYGISRGAGELVQGSVAQLRAAYPYSTFHFIFLHHVLEHMIAPAELLRELRSVLSPEGRIVVIVPDITQIACSKWPAGDALQFLHLAHKYNFTAKGLMLIGKKAGLGIRIVKPVEFPLVSRAPELWAEFVQYKCRPWWFSIRSGRAMVDYLVKIEKQHPWDPNQGHETCHMDNLDPA